MLMGCLMAAKATTRYVRAVAAGNGGGTNWANASADIQAMINASANGDEVWVAGGIYKPNRRADAAGTITPTDRYNAYVLKDGVKLYGGFAGTETLLPQRNVGLAENTSILSGDVNGDDLGQYENTADNLRHVVISAGNTAATLLDGFTISGGNASDGSLTVNSYAINGSSGGGACLVTAAVGPMLTKSCGMPWL